MSTTVNELDFEDDRVHPDEDEQLDVDESQPTPDEIDRASRMGWTDKDSYTGPPERWVDAKTFIERGETILPILKDRLRKQDDDLKGIRAELRQVIQTQGEFERKTRERIQEEFDERKRKAVEEADTEAYDAVHREEKTWQAAAPAAPVVAPGGNEVLDAWKESNTWFEKDAELTEFADDLAGVITKREPHLAGTPELLKRITARTKAAFPAKFTNPNRSGKGDVEGSTGPAGGGSGGKKTYADLPAAAKAKCDEYVANNWVSNKAEYVATYFGEE